MALNTVGYGTALAAYTKTSAEQTQKETEAQKAEVQKTTADRVDDLKEQLLEEQRAQEEAMLAEIARMDEVRLSKEAKEIQRMLDDLAAKKEQYARMNNKSPLSSNSTKLTQRLVNATMQTEVRSVISSAYYEISVLRLRAATSKGAEAAKAYAAINQLEKVAARASRKIRDLDGEDVMRTRQRRAKEKAQHKRADQIKEELKKQQRNRASREQGYLKNSNARSAVSALRAAQQAYSPYAPSTQKSEAAIEAEAEAIAEAEIAAMDSMPGGGEAIDVIAGEGGGEIVGGGDVSGGGEVSGGGDGGGGEVSAE